MDLKTYSKIEKVFSIRLIVILVLGTLLTIINKFVYKNSYIALGIICITLGYFICYFFNILWLKRLIVNKTQT